MRLPLFLPLLLLPFSLANNRNAVPAHMPLPDDFDEIDRTPPQTILLKRWPLSAGDDESKQVPIGMVRYSIGSRRGRYQKLILKEEEEDGEDEFYPVGME